MKVKILTMQIVGKNTTKTLPAIIDTSKPIESTKRQLKKILGNAWIDKWTGYKIMVTGKDKMWDEPTYNCIFVQENDKENFIFHFGCFASNHPCRFLIRKTYKTFNGFLNYLPQFVS